MKRGGMEVSGVEVDLGGMKGRVNGNGGGVESSAAGSIGHGFDTVCAVFCLDARATSD